MHILGFPGGTRGKEPTGQSRRLKRHRFYPWVGEIPLEGGMATHSSILVCRILWTEEPGGLQSTVGSHRVGHDRSDLALAQGIFWAQCLTFSKGTALSHWSRSLWRPFSVLVGSAGPLQKWALFEEFPSLCLPDRILQSAKEGLFRQGSEERWDDQQIGVRSQSPEGQFEASGKGGTVNSF